MCSPLRPDRGPCARRHLEPRPARSAVEPVFPPPGNPNQHTPASIRSPHSSLHFSHLHIISAGVLLHELADALLSSSRGSAPAGRVLRGRSAGGWPCRDPCRRTQRGPARPFVHAVFSEVSAVSSSLLHRRFLLRRLTPPQNFRRRSSGSRSVSLDLLSLLPCSRCPPQI